MGATVCGLQILRERAEVEEFSTRCWTGAAIGAAIGYSLDKQAQEVAQVLNTNVDNSPEAEKNPK